VVDEWDYRHWIGNWYVGTDLALTTRISGDYEITEKSLLTASGGLQIRTDGTYQWHPPTGGPVQGTWVKSDKTDYALVLKKAKGGSDYEIAPYGKDEKGRLQIYLKEVNGSLWYAGPRVGKAPAVPSTKPAPPAKAGAPGSAESETAPAKSPASGGAKPAAPADPPAPKAPKFNVGDAVEVFQGVGWQTAKIIETGPEGYKVDYEDRGFTKDEWAIPMRVRAVKAPIPGADIRLVAGTRLEVMHKFVTGKFALLKAKVIDSNSVGYVVHCEAEGDNKHPDHFVYCPEKRIESNIVRILGP
jgi:hypothetical protein